MTTQRKVIRNLRRIGQHLWTDGYRRYKFVEVDPNGDVVIPNATPDRVIAVDSDKRVQSIDDLSLWVKGTTDQIESTSGLNGTTTLSIADDLVIVSSVTAPIFKTGDADGDYRLVKSGDNWNVERKELGVWRKIYAFKP